MVSIIILAHNQIFYTKQCLKSLFEHTSPIKTPYEVIVVDNASTDGTKEYLQGLEQAGQIRVIYNSDNAGFPKGNNQAAAIANGEYICLLNNDTILVKNWLDNLLRCIKSDSALAAVGPYCNASSGYQQVNPQPAYKGDIELQKYAEQFNGEEKYVNFLVFFCCLIKRKVWDELGGLDNDFGQGCFEDNLFCWRLVEKGYKMKVCGNVFIHHYSGITFGQKKDPKQLENYTSLMAQNQKIFLRKIGKYETISLCMIVSDREKPEILKRCLDSVAQWVDEICVVFNYRNFGWFKKLAYQKLFQLEKKYRRDYGMLVTGCAVKTNYLKWTNFGDMRNKSLEMAWESNPLVGNEEVLTADKGKIEKLKSSISFGRPSSDWILWLDADDILLHPVGMRDVILNNPPVDAFRFKLLSRTEIGTEEVIYHTNLFRNKKEIRFTGRVHEDCNPAINKLGLKRSTTDITIQHLGYLNLKTWKQKNLRNYKLLLLDLKDSPSTLVYYHIINCLLIIGGQKNMIKAVQYVDECLEKFKMKQDDPLLPKMWVLRGLACMDAGQMLAAKQSFHKAYDEWKNIEGAVNLAELYMREKNWDKVIEILTPIYELKEFPITNIPMDTIQAECMMLQKLGFAYHHKAESTKDKEKIEEWIKKAEGHYREYLSIRQNLLVIEQLCKVLRQTNRQDEAAYLTMRAVNQFPGFFVGWFNLSQYELINKRYCTAKVFLEECLRIKPDHKEARHNLRMLMKGNYVRKRI